MSEATAHGRQLARHLAEMVGQERPRIRGARWKEHVLDVLIADAAPDPGVTTVGTLNLSEQPVPGQEYGVELVTAYSTGRDDDGRLDAFLDAGFFYLEHGVEMVPGTVLPDLIARRQASETMRHFFLIAPFLFGDALKSVRTDEREVRYLLAVPVSDQEMALAAIEGPDALDEVFDEAQIDIFDWNRVSVVPDE